MKTIINIISFFCLALFVASCARTQPVPKDKEAFIGKWKSASGYEMEIFAKGTADIKQIEDKTNPDYEKLCIKVAPQIIYGMKVFFKNDSVLEIADPYNYAKGFKINQSPASNSTSQQMVLNGVTLNK